MSSIRRLFPRSPADQPAICLSKAARASMLIVGTHRSTIMWRALLILLAIFFRYVSADSHGESPPEVSLYNGTLYAACRMTPSSTLALGLPRATGLVLFKQVDPHEKVRVLFRISGLKTVGMCDQELRAVHIHQYGDLSLGCDTTGGHYNPSGVNHPNHPGDFGNLEPKDGIINVMGESEATLFGGLSVIGRAVVMHERRDDLGFGGDAGSLLHGNAGPRLSCCVIGRSTSRLWNIYYKIYKRMLNSN